MGYKLAFYKAEYGTWLDKLVATTTQGSYSHVEFVLDENGRCFSSSARDGGVRYTNIDLTSGHWDAYELPNIIINGVDIFCNSQTGKKYDYLGAVFCLSRSLDVDAKNKWYCSEICSTILNKFFGFDINPHISPSALLNTLKSKATL